MGTDLKMKNFDTFIDLMQKNWPSVNETLILLFPRLGKIANHVDGYIAQSMTKEGLLASDFHLMTAIRRTKSVPPFEIKPSELCNYMLFSWGGLTKSMNRLEKNGIITRVACDQDKRIRMIRLTQTGTELIENIAFKLQQFHKELLTGFNQQEIALLDKLLKKLLDNIEKGEKDE